MPQRVADGHISVKGHSQQESRLHGGQRVDEKYLEEASFKADFSVIQPEDTENLGNHSGAKHQVIHREHAEEEIHGFMKTGLCLDDEYKDTISHHSQEIDQAKRDGDPDMSSLQPWDSKEEESSWVDIGSIRK